MSESEKEVVPLTRFPFILFEMLKKYFSQPGRKDSALDAEQITELAIKHYGKLGIEVDYVNTRDRITKLVNEGILLKEVKGGKRNNFNRKIVQYNFLFNWEFLETHDVVWNGHGGIGNKNRSGQKIK